MTKIIVNQIKLNIAENQSEAIVRAKKKLLQYISSGDIASLSIYKKSLDARKRDCVMFVYSVIAEISFTPDKKLEEKLKKENITVHITEKTKIKYGEKKQKGRITVIGFGPCGMFASLLLAENGYEPVIIERGKSISERTKSVDDFYKCGKLDINSNIQFGAGGAGTFSDGKLVTRISDTLCSDVLQRFTDFGAPVKILTEAKPHIGTDVLKTIVGNIEKKVVANGAEILYNTALTDYSENTDGTVNISLSNGNTMLCDAVILAIGHSARDTYNMLLDKNVIIEPKPFSVGVRIEHLQTDINVALYGEFLYNKYKSILPQGEYALSLRENGRGVYTFCMCPGGEVVAAASEENMLCVNGMSKSKRDNINANCAVAVGIDPSDYGNTPQKAIEFQRELERKAFLGGGGNYNAPVQTVGDFLMGKATTEPKRVLPSYMGGKYKIADVNSILPEFVCKMLKNGLTDFNRKIRGFAAPDAVLTAVETRTSAPLRILRNEGFSSISSSAIFPCGEGAGYAGGITSAAVDGMKTAIKIMEIFSPEKGTVK